MYPLDLGSPGPFTLEMALLSPGRAPPIQRPPVARSQAPPFPRQQTHKQLYLGLDHRFTVK